ncbi:MAG: AMP-binding protein [Steroidobacteraceae bacterium]
MDTFARDHLPPVEQWPPLVFSLPELQYPNRINAGAALLDAAVSEGHGNRPALHGTAQSWTYAQLLAVSNRMANVLVQEHGLVPGNRVLLRGPNSPLLAAAWLACLRAGAIAVTTMPMLRAKELGQIVRKAQINHVICESKLTAEVAATAAETGLVKRVVTYDGSTLDAAMSSQAAAFRPVETASDDVALLAFTSGTTGNPKATMHFHRDVLAMADIVARHLLETAPDDVYIGTPPLGFTFGLGALLVFPLRFRASVVLLERPTTEALLAGIQKFRATCLFTAPTMYRSLLLDVGRHDISSLRLAVSAGEPLPKATSDAWHAATGLRLIDGLGSTEMIHIFIAAKGADIRPGATGRPLPGYEAVVLDEHGLELPRGMSGRLAVRGPTGCRYLDDPRQSEYVQHGWNVTGDRYHVDADGYFWFEARADDMIVSAGYNIAGPEVECALTEHPAVRECAVTAAPDPERGQIVKAFVVANPSYVPGPQLATALQEFVKARIAPYKYPRAIEFIDALPKTQTGKIQRFVLRERAFAGTSEFPKDPASGG